MITMSRRQARTLRAVFRRHALGISHKGPVPPLVLVADPAAGLRVRHHQAHLAVECRLEGSPPSEEAITLPLDALAGMGRGGSLGNISAIGIVGMAPALFGAGALLFLTRHPFGKVMMGVACVLLCITLLDALAMPLHLPHGVASWAAACALPIVFALHRHVARSLVLAHQGNTATIASSMPLATAHMACSRTPK